MTHPNHKLTMTAKELKLEVMSTGSISIVARKYGVQNAAIHRKLASAGVPIQIREQRKPVKTAKPIAQRIERVEEKVPAPRADVMKWVTHSGARVSLPRISFLEDRA